MPGSYEALFHQLDTPRLFLNLRDNATLARELRRERLERAIGVIYRPETERLSHYFRASLPQQFDAVLHLDETRAVEPLERTPHWQAEELPETFPTGVQKSFRTQIPQLTQMQLESETSVKSVSHFKEGQKCQEGQKKNIPRNKNVKLNI